jgi:hypothetical protein
VEEKDPFPVPPFHDQGDPVVPRETSGQILVFVQGVFHVPTSDSRYAGAQGAA